MKNFITGMIFGVLVYPALTYCASIAETAANTVITKLSVVMAKDAQNLEESEPVHAIGFCVPDDTEEDMEEDE